MSETKRPRGRPRPQSTIDRDATVLRHLRKNGPLTRNQIAESLGLSKSVAYLSLSRLRAEGQVRTCADTAGSSTVWSSEVQQPCP